MSNPNLPPGWTEKNPAYAVARETSPLRASPSTRMQVARGSKRSSNTALGEAGGGHIERAGAFTSALRNPETLLKAEVAASPKPLKQILTPQQLAR